MVSARVTLWIVASLAASASAPDKPTSKELAELVRADQDDQAHWGHLGDAEASRRQDTRKKRVLEIVARGELDKPLDYANAALLLQHGSGADDFLLAHVLASTAAFDG